MNDAVGAATRTQSFGALARFDGIDTAGVNACKDKAGRLWKGLAGKPLNVHA